MKRQDYSDRKPDRQLEQKILQLLSEKRYTPQKLSGLSALLGLSAKDSLFLAGTLRRLEREGKIVRIKKNRYVIPSDAGLVVGQIRFNRRGDGIVYPDNLELPQIRIPPGASGVALHDDKVLVRIDSDPSWNKHASKPTGTVIRVLERARKKIVGSVIRSKHTVYVAPDDPRIPVDIAISPAQVKNVPQGHKVVVELMDWKSRHMSPEGRLVEVLGKPADHDVDMRCILLHYQLPESFPRAVQREASNFPNQITEEDLRGRVDCRNHCVVTIDPDDAKDYDDAICVETLSEGLFRIWVHIADVSHYVKAESQIDREALRRGNSTYLVDRVIPMLPEQLSNQLCSLKPNVDRLTKCVEFIIDDSPRVRDVKFYSAVICSRARLTYQQATEILRQKRSTDKVAKMLHEAHRIAQILRKKRFEQGSLNIELPEPKIRIDSQGRVISVERVDHDESHQLIEELMLLTNQYVARKLRHSQIPTIYRVHEPPDQEKLEELQLLMQAHNIPCGDLSLPGALSRLLTKLSQHPAAAALKIAVLRSMKRAKYSNKPLGHFGLAFADYTHFTSPIRRYADLLVHRALFGKKTDLPNSTRLVQISIHISATERNSLDAERDSRDLKMLSFFESQITTRRPQLYEAFISEIYNFGFCIEIPSLVYSGYVSVSSLEDDLYRFNPATVSLVGRKRKRTFRLGQKVRVRVLKVDRFKKLVEFTIVDYEA